MASVVQGSVVSHGSAPYKNDPANSDSYYVELQGDNDESRTLWGVGIRDAIQLKSIQNGEEVAFYDRGLAEGSKKRNWDVERFEKLMSYENSIEEGVAPTAEKTTSLAKTENQSQSLQRGKYDEADDEAELDLPNSIKNQYIYKIKNRALVGEKVNFYERDGEDGVVAFEDRNKSLHTSREDSKTIKSMLDVAQAKNWSSINLKGTEAFKREAWLEAKVRGIEVKGFKPEEKDLVELQKRQEDRSYNEVIGNKDRSCELNSQKLAVHTEDKNEDKALNSHAKNAGQAIALDASLAVATGSSYTVSSAVVSVTQDKLQNMLFERITEKEVEETRDDVISVQAEDNDASVNSNKWDAEELVKDYGLSKTEAGLLIKTTPTRDDFEKSITSFQEQFNVDRDQAINGLGSIATENVENEMNNYQHIDTEYEKFKDEQGLPPEYNGHSEEDEARLDKSVEQEALIRSNEFDVGRDIDPETEVQGDIEHFHDNLAAPTGAGVSKQAAMQKVEAAFDKKISPTQRNEVKENVEDSLDDRQKIAIEAMRRVINERFKNDDIRLEEKHGALNAKIPDIAAGKYELEPPTITEEQTVEVQTRDKGSKDKSM